MITTLIGALLFALVLAGLVYDTARLCTLTARHRPSLARLGGRRAAAVATERRLAHRLLTGRIDAATYRRRMTGLAHRTPHPEGVRHG
ncbi:hypothetical protein ACF09G_04205 [Streptomyces albogriseolus]|uniref:Uncharacterized protein n=2 Tax=unclassified Streptomyces TaxID=2593676 RepID=V9Z1P1_9ACTN|nr:MULTISPECIES: hypothetical protein [unclassified Streptomyces]AHE38981.1 hypothetical protein pFRL3_204 [Streptomyces sp. FR1]AHE39465.1 hypothetical protein pFRL4_232 [Streptomyces sp. F2]